MGTVTVVRELTTLNPTVIVCGPPFSGSSLVAGTLRLCGVHMGDNFSHPDTHQDLDFVRFSPELVAAIQRKNQKPMWGVKSVQCSLWLEDAFPYLRNPALVLCSRPMGDSVAKVSKYAQSVRSNLIDHLVETNFLLGFISKNDVPLCVVDFDTDKEELLDGLTQFLGLEISREQRENALKFNNKTLGYQSIG